jgi:hypothetical protein
MKNVLVVVDVQVHFKSVTDKYVDEIFELCKTFDEVYQIWDAVDVNTPDFKFPNQVNAIRKEYGGELLEEDIDYYQFSENDKERLREGFNNGFSSGEMFADGQGEKIQWFLYVGGMHEWFIIPEKLFTLFKKLKTEGKQIILCGGAEEECLEDIRVVAMAMDLESEILGTYVYS